MTITKAYLTRLCQSARLTISTEQESEILRLFSTEPGDGHEWTEQDIYEQIRKDIRLRNSKSSGGLRQAAC